MTPIAPIPQETQAAIEPTLKVERDELRLDTALDPLSDDDFENAVKHEAANYQAQKRHAAAREATKEENKRRRADNLPPLKLPAAAGKRRRTGKIQSRRAEEDESDVDGGGVESGRGRIGSRRPGRRRKDQSDELEESYEGQIILPYNPLYRLAGLPDPSSAGIQKKVEVMDILMPSSSATRPSNASDIAAAIPPIGSEPDPSSLASKDVEPAPTALGEPARENEDRSGQDEEDSYEREDEEIYVPWQAASDPRQDHVSTKIAEEEYSEDDAFAEDAIPGIPAKSTQTHTQTQSQQTPAWLRADDGIPAFRPVLPFAASSPDAEALYLEVDSSGPAVPVTINRYLKQYQRDGVRFLYSNYRNGHGAVLGDDMGLGKTIQVIAFLSAVMRKTGTSVDYERRKRMMRYEGKDIRPQHWATALIVCPTSLVRNWQRELDMVVIAPFETARITIERLKDLPFSVMIADEAHRLKEPFAGLTLAMKKVQCQTCFALTGTLYQNRMDEMWSVLDFVHRGHAGTIRQWKDFADPIKKGHRHEGTAYEVVMGVMRLGIMFSRILPHFYLRRDKRLIASELPEKRDMVVFCPLGARQIMAYQNLVDSEDVQFVLRRHEACDCGSKLPRTQCHHRTTSAGETAQDVLLKYISAFGKVANHFALLYHAKDDTPQQRHANSQLYRLCSGEDYDAKSLNIIEATLDTRNCGKWVVLESLLRSWRTSNEDNKVLIFSNSVRLLKMVAEFISLSFSGFPLDVLTGEVDGKERMEMVDRFQDRSKDHFILLISTLAGGVGLNLTAANKVVIFDPGWNPANDLQAMDRAFRIGQKRTVDVYRLIGQGTLEELKYERQIYKQQRSRQLNEGTFESRIHHGFEGGKTIEDQGELFGIQNIFRFNPEGFVPGNLERVRLAEDRFIQDLIEAEYDSEDEHGYDSDGHIGRSMARARKDQEIMRLHRKAEKSGEEELLRDVLDESPIKAPSHEDTVLKALSIEAHQHETAFRDSPEERQIYEIGIKLLQRDPELAKRVKANELGKLKRLVDEPGNSSRTSARKVKLETDPDDEPWKDRIQKRRRPARPQALAELSD